MDGLEYVIYTKAGAFRRKIVGVDSTAELVPNGISTAEFSLDDDHVAVPDAYAPGARCAVIFRGIEQFRGRIGEVPGEGPLGRTSFRVEGDTRKLWDWLGRQVPGAALNAQTSEYRVYTGKSEANFKTALAENIARLGVPWTVAPNHGYGQTKRVEMRMHPLADKLLDHLNADNLVITMSYPGGAAVVVDVREADVVPGVLTLESGVPDSYAFNRIAPTATRATVGGRGEGVEREFVEVIDTAREAEWGDIIEVFVDARNTEEGADLTIEGQQALDEGAPRIGVTTDLVETDLFMFTKTYQVGDLVHVKVGPVDTIQPVSVSISEDADGGVVVTPHIGATDVSADADVALANAVAQLARGVRNSGRR